MNQFNKNLVKKGKIYLSSQLPIQISNAIYTFGSNHITHIVAFIDTSDDQDGSHGMIITPDHLYFQFDKKGEFAYQDIVSLSLEKHRHQSHYKATIQTQENTFIFENSNIDEEILLQYLSEQSEKSIKIILSLSEKIEYYVSQVLKDIQNDEYEDLCLTHDQIQQLEEFIQELEIIHHLDDENYQYELEILCPKALAFFDELELDSDEIDILEEINNQLQKKQTQEDTMFEKAQEYYDDMMNKYKQGDTSMFDQMKGTMNKLGINIDELRGKSPEELNQYVDELCHRFGISRSQLDKMTKKFTQ